MRRFLSCGVIVLAALIGLRSHGAAIIGGGGGGGTTIITTNGIAPNGGKGTNNFFLAPSLSQHVSRFIFVGDSQSTDKDSYSGKGMSFPEWLVSFPAWAHGSYHNFATNGQTAAQIQTNFPGDIGPLLNTRAPAYLVDDSGHNDISAGTGWQSITNRMLTTFAMAKATNSAVHLGYIVPPYATNWNGSQLTQWTNLHDWGTNLVAAGVVEWVYDRSAFLTNRATQTVDGLHQTAAANFEMASQIAAAVTPANNYSEMPVKAPVEPVTLGVWSVPAISNSMAAANLKGLNFQLTYDTTSGYQLRAYDYRTSSHTPLRISGSPLTLNDAGGDTIVRGSLAAWGLTYFTNDARFGVAYDLRLLANGSIQLPHGTLTSDTTETVLWGKRNGATNETNVRIRGLKTIINDTGGLTEVRGRADLWGDFVTLWGSLKATNTAYFGTNQNLKLLSDGTIQFPDSSIQSTAYTGGAGSSSQHFSIACSDLETVLTTGTSRGYCRAPFAGTITSVRASLLTASSSGVVTADINVNGSSVLSTKLTVDASETTSVTAATPAVISSASVSDDDVLTVDIDTAGTGAVGLIVTIEITP